MKILVYFLNEDVFLIFTKKKKKKKNSNYVQILFHNKFVR